MWKPRYLTDLKAYREFFPDHGPEKNGSWRLLADIPGRDQEFPEFRGIFQIVVGPGSGDREIE